MIVRSSTKGRVAVGGGRGGGDGDGTRQALPSQKDKSKRKKLPEGQQPSTETREPLSAATPAPAIATAPADATGAPPLASPSAVAKSPARGETGRRRTRRAQHHQDHRHHKLDRSESRILAALVQQGQEAAAQAEALRNEAKGVEESASKHAADAKERARELVQASKRQEMLAQAGFQPRARSADAVYVGH